MEKTSLKAREIEALTFMFTPEATADAGGDLRRRRWLGVPPATVGLTAAFVVLAALAWAMFFR